jgi:hypothetical protein
LSHIKTNPPKNTDHATTPIEKAKESSATMTTISPPASTLPSTPAPHLHIRVTHEAEFFKPLSPTAIGLMCGLGSCGILGLIIWAVIYFRGKPAMLSEYFHQGERNDEENNMDGSKGHKGGRPNTGRSVFLQDGSGFTTTRHSVDGVVCPSVGIAVNAGLEREILDILEAEASVRAMSRMAARA